MVWGENMKAREHGFALAVVSMAMFALGILGVSLIRESGAGLQGSHFGTKSTERQEARKLAAYMVAQLAARYSPTINPDDVNFDPVMPMNTNESMYVEIPDVSGFRDSMRGYKNYSNAAPSDRIGDLHLPVIRFGAPTDPGGRSWFVDPDVLGRFDSSTGGGRTSGSGRLADCVGGVSGLGGCGSVVALEVDAEGGTTIVNRGRGNFYMIVGTVIEQENRFLDGSQRLDWTNPYTRWTVSYRLDVNYRNQF